jgi:hypothetical protein
MLYVDSKGRLRPDQAIVIWNHPAQGSYRYPQTLSYADRNYSPPSSHNKDLDVSPKFVDEANSSLIAAHVVDGHWGSTDGTVDLGAFGMNVPPHRSSETQAKNGHSKIDFTETISR